MEINKTAKEIAEVVSDSAKNLIDKAKDVVGVSKETTDTIRKDVDELVDWIEKSNDIVQQGNELEEVKFENLPTLGKVIIGGEKTIQQLPEETRDKYVEYFKKNGYRIALLTAVNPLFGLGALGTETAASGLVSTKAGIGTMATGVGLIGTSAAASAITPISYFAWSTMKTVVPALRIIGTGALVFGAGATLFKSVESLPQGKKIIEVFDKKQALYNDAYTKLENNLNKMGEVFSEQIKNSLEKLTTFSKKCAINIDDAIHSDQNLRLMQYQQIIVDLYSNQMEIIKTLSGLTEVPQSLNIENKKLAKRISQLGDEMQILGHCAEYLK